MKSIIKQVTALVAAVYFILWLVAPSLYPPFPGAGDLVFTLMLIISLLIAVIFLLIRILAALEKRT